LNEPDWAAEVVPVAVRTLVGCLVDKRYDIVERIAQGEFTADQLATIIGTHDHVLAAPGPVRLHRFSMQRVEDQPDLAFEATVSLCQHPDPNAELVMITRHWEDLPGMEVVASKILYLGTQR